jgi:hypothetical protein
MNAGGHRHLEFGSDAIGAGDQHRLFPFLLIEDEQPAEAADSAQNAGSEVRLAWWRMRCLAASAAAMSTPASAYFMDEVAKSVSSPGARNAGRSLLENNRLPRGGCGIYSKLY